MFIPTLPKWFTAFQNSYWTLAAWGPQRPTSDLRKKLVQEGMENFSLLLSDEYSHKTKDCVLYNTLLSAVSYMGRQVLRKDIKSE